MAYIKYNDKSLIATIDCSQEIYEKIETKLKRIKKNIRRDMWKKGIKKR